MRWKMCPKCGTKMTHDAREKDLDIYTCHICKLSFFEFKGKLLKHIEEKAESVDKKLDQFLIDILDGIGNEKKKRKKEKGD